MEIIDFVRLRKSELKQLAFSSNRCPHLAIFQVGHDSASDTYIRGKRKDADELGFKTTLFSFPEDVLEEELLRKIKEVALEPQIDGIIVQLPLPKTISPSSVKKVIPLEKDVDGFSLESPYIPCTPKGILMYLKEEKIPLEGKNAVVLGRSEIVGKPMAKLLLQENMNVTVLHSRTSLEDEKFYIAHADVIVAAIGKIHFLDDRFNFKKSSVLIDVGINRGEDQKLHGDILPNRDVYLQTPVPKGVGLLTRLALMENLWEAAKRRKIWDTK